MYMYMHIYYIIYIYVFYIIYIYYIHIHIYIYTYLIIGFQQAFHREWDFWRSICRFSTTPRSPMMVNPPKKGDVRGGELTY